MPLAAVVQDQIADEPTAVHHRHHNEGHGRRLTAAFDALETFPVLAESRNRVVRLFEAGEPAISELVVAVESDAALAVAVLRKANEIEGPERGKVATAVRAVEILGAHQVLTIAEHAPTFDFFQRSTMWHGVPDRFRLHSVATQHAAGRIAQELDYEQRDRLMITSLLHDVGKLVLIHAYPGYPRRVHGDARTPEDRIGQERRELGVDHAVVGGVLARRWGMPKLIAGVIEHHHDADAEGEAAIVRLADMLTHYALSGAVSPAELLAVSRRVGMGPRQLRTVMYDLPLIGSGPRPRHAEPCPLSSREVEVLRRLARGMVYKQIAAELNLSTSTVRTHLHNVYGKLGAMDRAQAVLIATEHGWI